MNLNFNLAVAEGYKSPSQIARVLTEDWLKTNIYCPNCTAPFLEEFTNNRPVADFHCLNCREEYELKSKKGYKIGKKVIGGAYYKMIKRIQSNYTTENP